MSDMPTATDRMRERAQRAERNLGELRKRIAQLGVDYAGVCAERERLADDLRAVTAVINAMLEEMGGDPTVAALEDWTRQDGCDEAAMVARLQTALMCILSVWHSRRHQPRRPEQSEPAQPAQQESGTG